MNIIVAVRAIFLNDFFLKWHQSNSSNTIVYKDVTDFEWNQYLIGAPVICIMIPASYFILDRIADHNGIILLVFSNIVCILMWEFNGYLLILFSTLVFYTAV